MKLLARKVGRNIIGESVSKNSLIDGSEEIGQDSDNLMTEIERYLKNRKGINNERLI